MATKAYSGRVRLFLQAAAAVLALAHGITALAYGITGYGKGVVYIGPVVLVALTAAIITALARRRMRGSWRWVHRLNYLVFAAVLVHGLVLGYDMANEVLLKAMFIFYAAVVAAGLVYRLTLLAKGRRSARVTRA